MTEPPARRERSMNDQFLLAPIGEVRTARTDPATTPVQTALNPGETGTVELHPEHRDGLHELDGFDHVWLITWLGRPETASDPPPLRQVPFLLAAQPRPVGLFAMRGPRRPNPIGLHLVRLVALTDRGFAFRGVDMTDRTPLLDVKPWVAPLDLPPERRLDAATRNGWFDSVDLTAPHTPSSLHHRARD